MRNAKMLVVEDERVVAMDIQRGLTNLGYPSPEIASTGREALEKANEIRPDLVLMDIRLKGDIDGIEAATRIRRRLNIPVVYLTAYADDTTLDRATRTQPYGYILKPFREKDLDTSIEVALYKHKQDTRTKERLQRQVSNIQQETETLRLRNVVLEEAVQLRTLQFEELRGKGELVRELQRDHPDWPQKRIAMEAGVSRAAVGHALRREREEQFPPDEYCGAKEVAKILGVSRKSVATWVREGRLKAERFGPGGRWVFSREYIHSLTEAPDEQTEESPLIAATEAARLLGSQRRTLWHWARQGKIKAIKPADSRGWRFRLADVQEKRRQL
jgi:excisionase family DNA binding protein